MKKQFVKAEVRVIKFECQDILTGPSSDPDYYFNEKLGAYVSNNKFIAQHQIYKTDYKLGDAEKNVTGPLGFLGAWAWMEIDEFKNNSDLMAKISSCM